MVKLMTDVIRFGIPKGDLNSSAHNKGNTTKLLNLIGITLKGYDSNAEQSFPRIENGDDKIQFICMKPRQLPAFLESGMLDLAIIGQDDVDERYARLWQRKDYVLRPLDQRVNVNWLSLFLRGETAEHGKEWSRSIKEWNKIRLAIEEIKKGNRYFSGTNIIDSIDLGYGKVEVIFAGLEERLAELEAQPETLKDFDKLSSYFDNPVIIASAYPNLTYRELCKYTDREGIGLVDNIEIPLEKSESFSDIIKSISNRAEREGFFIASHDKKRIRIFPFRSKTEAIGEIGFADMIVDCKVSGESLRKHHLVQVGDPIMTSTAHLYRSAHTIPRYGGVIDFSPWFADPESKYFKKYLNRKKDIHWKNEKINQITNRLKAASLEYGKTRQDSIYYKE